MKRCLCILNVIFFVSVLGAAPGFAAPGGVPQASISLKNSDAALCHANNTEWELTKTPAAEDVLDGETAEWTVTVTKGATSSDYLTVKGFVQVQNTGSAPATIGNIVVNLQHREIFEKKETWVSASADIADAEEGDTATSAKIVAAASQENPDANDAYNNPQTYEVDGQKGIFNENGASGELSFFDIDLNDIWAIRPQQTIAAGAAVNLLFSAQFDNTVLGIPEGELVRAEVIVSFGNSGARGGSGASGSNIDINGNGTIDLEEA